MEKMIWYVIPLFSSYEINGLYEVRNRKTGHIVSQRNGFVNIYRECGTNRSNRSARKLFEETIISHVSRQHPAGTLSLPCESTTSLLDSLKECIDLMRNILIGTMKKKSVAATKIAIAGVVKKLIAIWHGFGTIAHHTWTRPTPVSTGVSCVSRD